MFLYSNKNQEKVFHLHEPRPQPHSNFGCEMLKLYFPNFLNCENSYVLAEPTREYNCIGWAIGVKQHIDPAKRINKHYNEKKYVDEVSAKLPNGVKKNITLFDYTRDVPDCLKATKSFFDKHSIDSLLPKKDNYIAVEKISYPPSDDTIAFYFKEGIDEVQENSKGEISSVRPRGFTHAARYVKDVHEWVSDIWTSKLGDQVLITHEEHDLDGDTYGNILCYLVAEDRNTETTLSGESVKEEL